MCVSYFGIVTYQFEETFEFLYLVVGYGGFGLIGINQQVVGGGVVLVVQRGYFSYEVYCTGPGLRIVVRTYFREVVAECEIGVFIFFSFSFISFGKIGLSNILIPSKSSFVADETFPIPYR